MMELVRKGREEVGTLNEGGVPAEHNPDLWGSCVEGYDVFAEGVTRAFADDAIRLVRLVDTSRVIDVGAGTGTFSFRAARQRVEVLATDFSKAMVEKIRWKSETLGMSNVSAEVMDGQNLRVPENSFDVAASLFSLPFFPDPLRGMHEMVRVLKPGGRALIATWAPVSDVELFRVIGDAAMTAMLELPSETNDSPLRYVKPEDIAKQLVATGFQRAHAVSVKHVWVFDRVEQLAQLLPMVMPVWRSVFRALQPSQIAGFRQAMVDDFQLRQGDGPYAVTCHAYIAVATKAA